MSEVHHSAASRSQLRTRVLLIGRIQIHQILFFVLQWNVLLLNLCSRTRFSFKLILRICRCFKDVWIKIAMKSVQKSYSLSIAGWHQGIAIWINLIDIWNFEEKQKSHRFLNKLGEFGSVRTDPFIPNIGGRLSRDQRLAKCGLKHHTRNVMFKSMKQASGWIYIEYSLFDIRCIHEWLMSSWLIAYRSNPSSFELRTIKPYVIL